MSSINKKPPDKIDNTLKHALDMLECYGVPGTMAVCLLEDGGTLLRANGICQDTHGLLLALRAIAESIQHSLANSTDAQSGAYRELCGEVVRAVSTATGDSAHRTAH